MAKMIRVNIRPSKKEAFLYDYPKARSSRISDTKYLLTYLIPQKNWDPFLDPLLIRIYGSVSRK